MEVMSKKHRDIRYKYPRVIRTFTKRETVIPLGNLDHLTKRKKTHKIGFIDTGIQ